MAEPPDSVPHDQAPNPEVPAPASAPTPVPAPPSPVTKREILGWCMYDVADSAYTTVIVTTLYALYYKLIVVGDNQWGDFLWGLAASISEIVIALLAPIAGAIADFSGSRKKFLAASAVVLVTFTASLTFVGPGMITLGIVLYVLATLGFAGGGLFIDSFLPGLSNESNAGRISGLKWAMGYAGGLLALLLTRPLAEAIVSNPSPEQLSRARLIPLIIAGYYAVAVLPTFFFLRERSSPQSLPPGENYFTVGFRRVIRTLRHIRRYRELFKLFLAFLIYNDGIVTVITFAAVYAQQSVGFTASDVVLLFLVMNVIALVGALSFGWLADRIGQKSTILISLTLWIAAVVIAFLTRSKASFWVVGALAGIGMGSCQSVTRSLVALFTPKQNAAEFFGFLGLAGKAVAFLGPIMFGTISAKTGNQRLAILSVGVFFVAGMILLLFVNEQKGKEASRIPVDA